MLSWKPLVVIGQMSYSLYLWHWPIFSFVDYKFYLASLFFRIGLKVALSLTATAICFFLIEKRGRIFFNNPNRRPIAFAFLGCSLLLFVPLGIAVRRANYVDASMRDVAHGGVFFNESGKNGTIVLMGDSNGAMYGRAAKEIAENVGIRLNVISVPAGDPLPRSSGQQPQLWLDSLAVVRREKPDFLMLVCDWQDKLKNDRGRLGIAVKNLKPYVHYLILVTQPPVLPELANRESIRNGSRPPFIEESNEHAARMASNALIKALNGNNVIVIDIEHLFAAKDGTISFTDGHNDELFQDRNHLSAAGAELVKTSLLNVITDRELNR